MRPIEIGGAAPPEPPGLPTTTRSLDRRTFFRYAGTMGVGAVAWACTKKTKTPKQTPGALAVAVTGQILAKGDTRQAFALFRGEKAVAPTDVTARIAISDGKPLDVKLARQRVQKGSGDKQNGQLIGTETFEIYVFEHAFEPGVWLIDVATGGESAQAAFQIMPDTPEPTVGKPAIPSQSPTTSDHNGVDPICTRTPPCSMHEITIADAIQKGPTVISFATPRYCQSRTCGPTVDIIEDVSKAFKESVSFVHVEVFRNEKVALTENGDSPTFHEWHLGTEPWTYFVGADGIIKNRWLGSIGSDELQSAVSALVKG